MAIAAVVAVVVVVIVCCVQLAIEMTSSQGSLNLSICAVHSTSWINALGRAVLSGKSSMPPLSLFWNIKMVRAPTQIKQLTNK
jgi:hypothetical protein